MRNGGRVSKPSAGGELEEDAEAKSSVELKILRGVGLKGDSMFDKLDSFVIVKPGTGTDISRDDASGRGDGVGFRTPTQYDKGPNPEINASGKLGYSDEEGLEFYVYSEDKRSNELIGVAFLPKAEFLTESFSGKLALAGAFSGKGASKKAGHLVVDVSHVEAGGNAGRKGGRFGTSGRSQIGRGRASTAPRSSSDGSRLLDPSR